MEDEARKSGYADSRFNFKHKKRLNSTGRSTTEGSADRSELSKSKNHGKKVRVIVDDEHIKVRGASARGDKHVDDN